MRISGTESKNIKSTENEKLNSEINDLIEKTPWFLT